MFRNKFENKDIIVMGNGKKKYRGYEMAIDDLVTIEVEDFTMEYPHNIPYLTLTGSDGLVREFGMVNEIDDISTEENYIITKIAYRPEALGKESLPSTYRFNFNNNKSMISFINQVMISKRMY